MQTRYCPKCQREIAEKAWQLHQFLCKGQTQTLVGGKPDSVQHSQVDTDKQSSEIVPVTVGDGGQTSVPAEQVSDKSPVTASVPIMERHEVFAEPESRPSPAPIEYETNLHANGSEIFYPTVDKDFIVTQYISNQLDVLERESHEKPTNMLITGFPGGGKTSLAIQFAAKYNRPCVKSDFGVVQEPQQLFQTTKLIKDGDVNVTETRDSAFVRGIETERCVVIMDELTRVENERCLNPLMPILDGNKSAWIDELRRRVRVAPGVVFFATINEGALFCGVSSLDQALRDRFKEIFLDYLPTEQELKVITAKTGVPDDIALSLVEFGHKVRSTPTIVRKISTRQLLTAASSFKHGAALWEAVESAIGNYNDTAWRQQVMESFSLSIRNQDEYEKYKHMDEIHGSYVTYV